MARVKRPDFELTPQLEEQVGFLLSSMDAYDAGTTAEAKRVAVVLRVLLHDHGQSRSLLAQLGLKRCDFYDSAGELPRGLISSAANLTITRVTSTEATFMPICGHESFRRATWRRFEPWWTTPVIRTKAGDTFSRSDLVLSTADQDGGAHIDPALEERYYRLTRDNAVGWEHCKPDGTTKAMEGPVAASVRQIGHEVFMTLQRWAVGCLPEGRRLPRAERRRS